MSSRGGGAVYGDRDLENLALATAEANNYILVGRYCDSLIKLFRPTA